MSVAKGGEVTGTSTSDPVSSKAENFPEGEQVCYPSFPKKVIFFSIMNFLYLKWRIISYICVCLCVETKVSLCSPG